MCLVWKLAAFLCGLESESLQNHFGMVWNGLDTWTDGWMDGWLVGFLVGCSDTRTYSYADYAAYARGQDEVTPAACIKSWYSENEH